MNILKGPMLLCLLPVLGCAHILPAVGTGPNLVAGRATLSTGSYSRPCEDILIVPATNETRNMLAAAGGSSEASFIREVAFRSLLNDARFQGLAREIDCQPDGSFAFHGISDGQYLLMARVTWLMRWAHHGGYVIRQVDVAGSRGDIEMAETKDNA